MGNSSGNGIFVELAAGRVGAGRYQPGETVRGTVHLNIQTELKVRGVFLRVSGAEVAGIDNLDIIESVLNGGLEDSNYKEHKYFNTEVPLMPPTTQGRLQVGQYSIPFSFVLSSDCPPSFSLEGSDWTCSVEYRVKAICVVDSLRLDLEHTQRFEVTGVMPAHPAPLTLQDCKRIPRFGGLGTAGQLWVDLHLPRNVWFAGDRLECSGTITNDSKKTVDSLSLLIERHVAINPKKESSPYVVKKDIARLKIPRVGAQARSSDLQLSLNLPTDLVPSCKGRRFSIRYVVSVECPVSLTQVKAEAEVFVCAAQGTAPSPLLHPPAPSTWDPEVLPLVVVPAVVYAI
eukprot:EG_transcript_8165